MLFKKKGFSFLGLFPAAAHAFKTFLLIQFHVYVCVCLLKKFISPKYEECAEDTVKDKPGPKKIICPLNRIQWIYTNIYGKIVFILCQKTYINKTTQPQMDANLSVHQTEVRWRFAIKLFAFLSFLIK